MSPPRGAAWIHHQKLLYVLFNVQGSLFSGGETPPLPWQKVLCCPGRRERRGLHARHRLFQDVKKTGNGFRAIIGQWDSVHLTLVKEVSLEVPDRLELRDKILPPPIYLHIYIPPYLLTNRSHHHLVFISLPYQMYLWCVYIRKLYRIRFPKSRPNM